jgi:RimJ/RimL family protein N-acetyltransferase
MGDVVIREAIEADAKALSLYMATLLAENLATMNRRPAPSVEDEVAFIRKAANAERAAIVLAAKGERVVGLLDFWAGDSYHNRHAGRFGMSVAEDWRGKGVGRRMLEALIAKTKTWPGFCRIELDVLPWNAPAIALYESLGFTLEARRKKAVDLQGEPEDMLLMALVW